MGENTSTAQMFWTATIFTLITALALWGAVEYAAWRLGLPVQVGFVDAVVLVLAGRTIRATFFSAWTA